MPHYIVPVIRTVQSFVLIELPEGKGVHDAIKSAEEFNRICENQIEPEEWQEVSTFALVPRQIEAAEAGDLPVYRPFASEGRTLEDRAAEIGVTRMTLNRWERDGVDVWDDGQVREKISKSRNYNPRIARKFRARP